MDQQHLGAQLEMQYGRTGMRVNRHDRIARVLLVAAVVLASLWLGGLAASAKGDPADHLAAGRPQHGIEPAARRDRAPVLRLLVDRPDARGRVVPLLLGALAGALTVACLWRAEGAGPDLTRVRSLVRSTPLAARAPPLLQSA
ncbi:MAG TPA: hypothetical protein VG276_14545 [Actinomycetes bacterium]|nr:hypothetical protein [Actinomycetes bacterium]